MQRHSQSQNQYSMLILRAYETSEGLVYSEKQKKKSTNHTQKVCLYIYLYIIHSQQWFFFSRNTRFLFMRVFTTTIYIHHKPEPTNNIIRSDFTVLNEPVLVFTFICFCLFCFYRLVLFSFFSFDIVFIHIIIHTSSRSACEWSLEHPINN